MTERLAAGANFPVLLFVLRAVESDAPGFFAFDRHAGVGVRQIATVSQRHSFGGGSRTAGTSAAATGTNGGTGSAIGATGATDRATADCTGRNDCVRLVQFGRICIFTVCIPVVVTGMGTTFRARGQNGRAACIGQSEAKSVQKFEKIQIRFDVVEMLEILFKLTNLIRPSKHFDNLQVLNLSKLVNPAAQKLEKSSRPKLCKNSLWY